MAHVQDSRPTTCKNPRPKPILTTSFGVFVFICVLYFVTTSAHAQQSEQTVEPLSGENQELPDVDIAGSQAFRRAADEPFKFFTFTLENDFFVNEDDGFTNAIGVTIGTGPFLTFSRENLPWHLDALTKNTYIQTTPDRVHGVAHMLFQSMQTPRDISIPELQEDDVPYAGLLALQSTLYSWDTNVSDQLSLTLGAVGPATLAEQAQTRIHEITGSERPQGWDNQLQNEFVFNVEAQRVSKLYRNYGPKLGFDVVGMASGSLGNLRSDTQLGVAVRWGSSLDFSHATFALKADRQVNSLSLSESNDFFVYFGFRGGIVFNDILIDGNTFSDSHSVPLEHYQDIFTGGIVWKYGPLSYVFQLTSVGSPSEIKPGRDEFGAISVTVPYK